MPTSCQPTLLTPSMSTLCHYTLLTSSTSTSCEHTLLTPSMPTSCQHSLLTPSTSTSCQHTLLTSSMSTSCQQTILTSSTSTSCQHTLLTLQCQLLVLQYGIYGLECYTCASETTADSCTQQTTCAYGEVCMLQIQSSRRRNPVFETKCASLIVSP
ncbi:hypothetical protein MAR_030485 [Mya arenaria]|uniref:Snake toxin/toxin-like domain-containing protein n=1 Tax=Mya arenaria TaxID=6604 RepID=A0ABY7F512_MYAAR|nr:hypothetical protein MAR_030485 [Mya arenaria]